MIDTAAKQLVVFTLNGEEVRAEVEQNTTLLE